MEVCRFFLQGRCAYGTACRSLHQLPNQGEPPTAAYAPDPPATSYWDFNGEQEGYAAASSSTSFPPPPPPQHPQQASSSSAASLGLPVSAYAAAPSSSSAAAVTVEEMPASEAADADIKELKKLQKALREIESLETRRCGGEVLQANQVKKIDKKQEYETRIAELEERIEQAANCPPPVPPPPPPSAAAASQPALEARAQPKPRPPPPPAPTGPVCKHFLAGRCSFGNACRNSHDIGGAPKPQLREYQLQPSFNVEDPECGICFESILKRGERFGILENCDHAFCLSCIRSWRKQREQQDRQNLRLCPVCRNESFFVVPSDTPLTDPVEKNHVISTYKVEMARIPCKLFDYGRGKCPFGTSCFYLHLNPDGTRYIPPAPHWRKGAEGSEVQVEVKLSDFLEHSWALP
mmetsp:Transcript_11288/g.24434  ORF Transcript_11288/g.24434 Transcript_11288/m.24434 type:complete len:407 (-) Transcript_11288:23-1243(-)